VLIIAEEQTAGRGRLKKVMDISKRGLVLLCNLKTKD